MSHFIAFILGVGLGVGVLIAMDQWLEERNARFATPPDWAKG